MILRWVCGTAVQLILLVAVTNGPVQASEVSAGSAPSAVDSSSQDTLIRSFYKAPATGPILFRTSECGPTPCHVRLLKEDTWTTAAGEFRLLVTAAEPQDEVGHVSGAILGIALFQKKQGVWKKQNGDPRVDVGGSYGTAPEVEIVNTGIFGRGVVAKPGFTGQGVTEEEWILYLLIHGKYRRVLSLRAVLDHSGMCDPSDTACLRDDFSSVVNIVPVKDGVVVVQVKTGPSLNPGLKPASRWHISRSGQLTTGAR